MKNKLTKKQILVLCIGVFCILSSGVGATVFGVKKHAAKKSANPDA